MNVGDGEDGMYIILNFWEVVGVGRKLFRSFHNVRTERG